MPFTDAIKYQIEKNILSGMSINGCARNLGITNPDSVRRYLATSMPHLLPIAAYNGKKAQSANVGKKNKERYHNGEMI